MLQKSEEECDYRGGDSRHYDLGQSSGVTPHVTPSLGTVPGTGNKKIRLVISLDSLSVSQLSSNMVE